MSKKKYTLPQEISLEISETVEVVKNNIGTLNYKIVPISAIEFDPDNPRELAISRDDLPSGPNKEDPLFEKKMEEYESLKQIAETIKKYGVRNAVEIYKHGANYRLIHGERRCLSSILAGRKDIPAKILDEKPNDFDIRLLQLIENVQRENLTLHEMLNNIRLVIDEYKRNVDPNVTVNSSFVEGVIDCSKTHSLNVLAILNASSDFQNAIKKGKIKSLEKAALIAKAKTEAQREVLMRLCLEGASLKQLKQNAAQQKKLDNISNLVVRAVKKRPGKQAARINLGTTKNKAVVKKLMHLVLTDPLYDKFKLPFESLEFEDFGTCASAFSSLIQVMEKVENN